MVMRYYGNKERLFAAGVTEKEAIAIARTALEQHDIWADRAEFEARRTEDGWAVTIWRLPKTPGGHRLVEIDNQGRVVAYVSGE